MSEFGRMSVFQNVSGYFALNFVVPLFSFRVSEYCQ